MDRPTREQVDEALELDSLKYEAVLDAYNVLRAEVRALRAELDVLVKAVRHTQNFLRKLGLRAWDESLSEALRPFEK